MTKHSVRCAFRRSHLIPEILVRYPRLLRSIQRVASLDCVEAATCIRDFKAGHRWSGRTVDRYGGTGKLVNHAWKHRRVGPAQLPSA